MKLIPDYLFLIVCRNPYDPQHLHIIREYDEKMRRLHIPYDELRQLILEYDNFQNGHKNDETFGNNII